MIYSEEAVVKIWWFNLIANKIKTNDGELIVKEKKSKSQTSTEQQSDSYRFFNIDIREVLIQ